MLKSKMIRLLMNPIHQFRMFSCTTKLKTKDTDAFIKQHDHIQVSLLKEPCILVDKNDKTIGQATKKDCHLLENIKQKQMLHRAFSVFIFNDDNELLVTQRSIHKILFPNHWTNACCSHPLFIDDELDGANGVQSAARRRINYELGIETSNLNLNQFEYITRIQYHADNSPYDGIFGEHEIDYCLILKGNYKLIPSMNEVKAYRYLSMYQLKEFVDQGNDHNSGVLLTPWFKMICEKFLFEWWQNLDHLESVKDHLNIHKLN